MPICPVDLEFCLRAECRCGACAVFPRAVAAPLAPQES